MYILTSKKNIGGIKNFTYCKNVKMASILGEPTWGKTYSATILKC